MGLVYSLTAMMSPSLNAETSEEKRPDGTILTINRKNPWVSALTVLSAAIILSVVMDGGTGTLTRIFGRNVPLALPEK